MDETDLRELVAVFLLDAPGRLARIERHLRALERARLPAKRSAAVAAAAHEAHSLRGAAGSLRLEQLGAQAERLELALLDGAAGRPERAFARVIRDLLDAIGCSVAALEATGETRVVRTRVGGKTCWTVLYVEDNPVNVTLIERALARRPTVRLLTASNVETGLRLAVENRPDIVLLDFHLADGSGYKFLSCLRMDRALCEVPVVVVSGEERSRVGEPLEGLGILEYLTKPVDVGRLLALVDEITTTSRGRMSAGG